MPDTTTDVVSPDDPASDVVFCILACAGNQLRFTNVSNSSAETWTTARSHDAPHFHAGTFRYLHHETANPDGLIACCEPAGLPLMNLHYREFREGDGVRLRGFMPGSNSKTVMRNPAVAFECHNKKHPNRVPAHPSCINRSARSYGLRCRRQLTTGLRCLKCASASGTNTRIAGISTSSRYRPASAQGIPPSSRSECPAAASRVSLGLVIRATAGHASRTRGDTEPLSPVFLTTI